MGLEHALVPLAALALDELFGDPARLHPVAGFGQAAAAFERLVYRPSRRSGAAYALVCVAAPTAMALLVERRLQPPARLLLRVGCTAIALGGRTLRRTGGRMADLLDSGDLAGARELAPSLVSRRPEQLDAGDLARAAFESVAENTADAVSGPLLWGSLAGAPGAVAYRAVNTLDAMVGYRTPRYHDFGWAAARTDDVLNWPVARLTAAATVVVAPLAGGRARPGLQTWWRDGAGHPSPNAGRVEAAFAGALGVRVGGASTYGDHVEHRPVMGTGVGPDASAVRRAARLSRRASWMIALLLAADGARR